MRQGKVKTLARVTLPSCKHALREVRKQEVKNMCIVTEGSVQWLKCPIINQFGWQSRDTKERYEPDKRLYTFPIYPL